MGGEDHFSCLSVVAMTEDAEELEATLKVLAISRLVSSNDVKYVLRLHTLG